MDQQGGGRGKGVVFFSIFFFSKKKRKLTLSLLTFSKKNKTKKQDGYALVARSGRLAQEIHVTTTLPRDAMKQAVTRVLSKLV